MGSSVVALVRRTDFPVKFVPPPGTSPFYPGYLGSPDFQPGPGETLRFFYPTETGGQRNTIDDEPEIFDKALDQLYSAWDYVKNVRYVNEAKNWELVWVGPRVCKRESRRFIGDYVLNGNDVESGRFFNDAIAFGGFAEDIHYPREEKPEYVNVAYHGIPPIYTIPYRSIYSKDIGNLFYASRLLSVSHIAHGTVRLQRTLAAIGQAAGAAAWLCKRYACGPRDIYTKHIAELQQQLLKDDASIPGVISADPLNLAPHAAISADEERRFLPDSPDRWLVLTLACGVMLWDWPKHLESVSFLLKNSGEETKLQASLKLRSWPRGWKKHTPPVGFPYEAAVNEVEWADDNSTAVFKETAKAEALVPRGEYYVKFQWNLNLIPKQDTCDEERYLIEIEMNPRISLAIDNRFFAAARFVRKIDDCYEAGPHCPVMTIEPVLACGEAANIIDGVSRRFSYNPLHMWQTRTPAPHYVVLEWKVPQKIGMVQITFDTLTRTFHEMPLDCGKRVHEKCVKNYRLLALINDAWVLLVDVRDNFRRFRRHVFEQFVTDKLMLAVDASWGGDQPVGVYEIRVYEKPGQ
jgi:hypothetical protein